jgi:outer membrane protein
MLKKSTLALLVFSLTAFVSVKSEAQAKIAYINMQQLVTSMPEAKRAYDSLQLMQQEYSKDGQALLAEFQTKVAAFNKAEPTMKADLKEVKIKELETAKAGLEEYQAKVEQKIAAREQQMTIPIIAKAKKAVSDIATEKGYTCVIDNSKDVIVVATCEDLMAAAKLKLGIK